MKTKKSIWISVIALIIGLLLTTSVGAQTSTDFSTNHVGDSVPCVAKLEATVVCKDAASSIYGAFVVKAPDKSGSYRIFQGEALVVSRYSGWTPMPVTVTELDGGTFVSAVITKIEIVNGNVVTSTYAGANPSVLMAGNDVGYAIVYLNLIKNGKDGRDGKDGAVGPMGPQGPQGIQGLIGPKGDKGDSGTIKWSAGVAGIGDLFYPAGWGQPLTMTVVKASGYFDKLLYWQKVPGYGAVAVLINRQDGKGGQCYEIQSNFHNAMPFNWVTQDGERQFSWQDASGYWPELWPTNLTCTPF